MKPPDHARNREGWVCPRPWVSMSVNGDDGDVYPCCWGKRAVGNLDEETAEQIWNGARMQQLRKDLSEGNYQPHCGSHCPVAPQQYDVASGFLFAEREGLSDGQRANREQALVHLKHRDRVVSSKPLHARIFVTNRCGMECAHCDIWRQENKRERDFVERFAFAMPSLLQLEGIGGEPLMSRHWLHFIKDVDQTHPGLHLKMVVNGKFISENVIEKHFPPPKAWTWIGVSMDAARPSTLAILRQGLDLDVLREGVVRLARYAEGRFTIGIIVTVMKDNVFELEEILAWFRKALPNQRVRINFCLVEFRDDAGTHIGQGALGEEHFATILKFCSAHRFARRVDGLGVLARQVRARRKPWRERMRERLGSWFRTATVSD